MSARRSPAGIARRSARLRRRSMSTDKRSAMPRRACRSVSRPWPTRWRLHGGTDAFVPAHRGAPRPRPSPKARPTPAESGSMCATTSRSVGRRRRRQRSITRAIGPASIPRRIWPATLQSDAYSGYGKLQSPAACPAPSSRGPRPTSVGRSGRERPSQSSGQKAGSDHP